MSLPVDDLQCAVCCDIFTDPVLLSCSHSFCRECVLRFWETCGSRECPMCRKRASKASPTTNLALRNLCQSLLEAGRDGPADEGPRCHLHAEKLKLFCLADKQPICVVCQASKAHKGHDCSAVQEAVVDCKDELTATLARLRERTDSLKEIHANASDTVGYIKRQALETRAQIKAQFEQLHQFLHREEAERLSALKREEDEKVAGMKEKVGEIAAETLSLEESLGLLESELQADDMTLLQNFKAIQDSCNSIPLGPVTMSGSLIDMAKHLSNLKYSVWENMNNCLEYTPVTLDPNTAHPYLILSEDLTSFWYSGLSYGCPDNPERFRKSAEVVGLSALGSGSHHWMVDTGGNRDWLLGVASVSTPRDAEVAARPENGFWTLCYRDGELRAMTSPPAVLPLSTESSVCRIRLQLDYDKGTLCFYDCSGDETPLYTFESTFTEMLLPYFYTQSKQPLRILSENVIVTTMRSEVCKPVI